MYDSDSNGGDNSSTGTKALAVVITVLLAVGGTAVATSINTSDLVPEFSSDFDQQEDEIQLSGNGAAWETEYSRIKVAGGGSNGVAEYVDGTPNNADPDSLFAMEVNSSAQGGNSGWQFNMFTDGSETGNNPPDNGYSVTIARGNNKIHIQRHDGGSTTSVATNSSVGTLGGESKHIETTYRNGTITVYKDGAEVLQHTINKSYADHSQMSFRAWSSSTDGYATWLKDATIYKEKQDSDGDGTIDMYDPYPYDAPNTYLEDATDNETVESAYIEATNGSFDISVYGINNSTNEQILLTEGSKTVDETQLVALEVPTGYDQYKLEYHGNATVESHGLIYAASGGGGGISEDTYWSGIANVISNQFALQAQNVALGFLIVIVGAILFRRSGGDC